MIGITLFDIYMAAAILGSGYVVVSAFLGHVSFSAGGDVGGGDLSTGDASGMAGHDLGHDLGHDAAHDTGLVVDATDEPRRAFSAFSPTIIASFLAGFGVVGLVLQKGYGWSAVSALPAGAGGLLLAAGLKAFFNTLAAAASGSTHVSVRNLIGVQAEVTTPIGRKEPGEIAYVLQGSRFSRSARSADGKSIARGETVTIEAIDGHTTYVVRTDQHTPVAPPGAGPASTG